MAALCNHLLLILLCYLWAHWTCGAADYELGQLHPPTNITFGMNGMFCLFWKWSPTTSTAQCSLKYETEILTSSYLSPGGKDKDLYYTFFVDSRVDLNKDLTLRVKTECDNRFSDSKTFTSPLVTGNTSTIVRNMTCVWHYKEYVNCTWKPAEVTPPGINYSLRYWLTEETACPPVGNKEPTQFYDLLEEGEMCQNYIYENGIPVGCQFTLEKDLQELYYLVAVVTDRSHNSKPYIYFTCVNAIAKLKPPVINKIERTPSKSLLVSWNVSDVPMGSECEVQLNNEKPYLVSTSNIYQSTEIPNTLPDHTYTVKIRVKLHKNIVCLFESKNLLWSEWSEEWTLPAIEGWTIIYTVLLFLGSFVFIVVLVLLLINMRRLRILICPQIPDPGKGISSDFQHWLKYGKSVYNEPKKEEVCVVSLLETSSPVE